MQAEFELREDKLEDLAKDLAEREARIAERERDLAGYVGELQESLKNGGGTWSEQRDVA
jgi:hypothetical protein